MIPVMVPVMLVDARTLVMLQPALRFPKQSVSIAAAGSIARATAPPGVYFLVGLLVLGTSDPEVGRKRGLQAQLGPLDSLSISCSAEQKKVFRGLPPRSGQKAGATSITETIGSLRILCFPEPGIQNIHCGGGYKHNWGRDLSYASSYACACRNA